MTATITIAAHSRVYTDQTVAITGGTLTTYHDGSAIASGDTVYVYYDDPDRLGGAVAFQATATAGNAVASADNPARHYVGVITIPAAGAASSGTLVSPGGAGSLLIDRIGAGFR